MDERLGWAHASLIYSLEYLSEAEQTRLDLFDHGLLYVVNEVIWEIGDEPGKFIAEGVPGDRDDVLDTIHQIYPNLSKEDPDEVKKSFARLLEAGALTVDSEDGAICSPFVLFVHEKLSGTREH